MKDMGCYAELRHINLRKEGPEDDKSPAFDLKLQAMVTAEFIENLMLGDGEENGSVVASFWSEDGEPKFLSLEKVAIDRQVHNVMGTVEGLELRACKLKGFSFKPRGILMAELTFSVSTNDFPSNAVAVLAELLQEQVSVSMKAPQGDMFAKGEQPEPAAVE